MDRPNHNTFCQHPPKHHFVRDYTHPPPEPQRPPSQDDQEAGRDSLGSDCVPGMVEDHGSDISADDYEYQGTELWDSFWQSQINNRMSRASPYPALLSSPATVRKAESGQHLSMDRRGQLHILHQTHVKDQRSTSPMPLFGTTAERHRSKTPKPRPRASYSIFPPASPPGPPRCSLSRPRTGSVATSTSQSSIDTQRPSVSSRGAYSVDLTASQPKTPATLPKPTHATIRAVTPTPGSPLIPFPVFLPDSSRPSSRHKPLPELPVQARTASRRPSLANLRKLSFSKITTNSTPSLARLAQTQAQQAAGRAQSSLRPLPPLPTSTSTSSIRDRAPTPPVVSVFDFDSDGESVSGDTSARGFARRLIHGIAHPLHGRKEKATHARSASVDEGRIPGASSPSPRSRSRAETTCGQREDGDVGRGQEDKAWRGRGSSEVFGRILGRWSA